MSIRARVVRRRGMNGVLSKHFDLRAGESRHVLLAFATLGSIIAAQTTLETARDAIFMTRLPASRLNVVYALVAGLTLVATAAHRRLAARLGTKNALIASLGCAAGLALLLSSLDSSPRFALALYAMSSLVGAV